MDITEFNHYSIVGTYTFQFDAITKTCPVNKFVFTVSH